MKGVILAEMAFLYAGILLLRRGNYDSWLETIAVTAFKNGMAVAILLGLLLILADAGQPELAVAFGALVITGTAAYHGVKVSELAKEYSARMGGI